MEIILVILGYLAGSIPFGFVIGKAQGIDIRQHGSGNIGTSNVGRTLGKKAAIMTLLGDGLKGLLVVLLARWLRVDAGWIAAAGLAAVVGHDWPIFLKFKGGKGVDTTYAAFLGMAPFPALVTILIWVIITARLKTASVAALSSSVCAPILAYLFKVPFPYILFACIGTILIYLRHTENIKRLLNGTELTLHHRRNAGREQSE